MSAIKLEKYVILIIDDVPNNLAVLSDALDDAGYMVLVAAGGSGALELLGYVTPHLILLDAMMPCMDGFETCRRIRAFPGASQVPVIFMTGLTEAEHVVRGFEVGGNDYVTKPFQPRAVIARIESHLRSASMIALAAVASEAAANAVIVLDRDGAPVWQTSKALEWVKLYFPDPVPGTTPSGLPLLLHDYVTRHLDSAMADAAVAPLLVQGAGAELQIRFASGERSGDLLLILEKCLRPEPMSEPITLPMAGYRLTPRELDVLAWLAKGKTNRDIADILGMSPRTVNKHLEHIFVKLGVETRSAAAALVANRKLLAN